MIEKILVKFLEKRGYIVVKGICIGNDFTTNDVFDDVVKIDKNMRFVNIKDYVNKKRLKNNISPLSSEDIETLISSPRKITPVKKSVKNKKGD